MKNHLSEPFCHLHYFDLPTYAGEHLQRFPFSIRILLENTLRHAQGDERAAQGVEALLEWQPVSVKRPSVPFSPARVLLQDLTGVPLVVDLAAIRSACVRMGGNPANLSPQIPVDLVIDHSLQVDFNNSPNAMGLNVQLEYARNRERYELLRWAQDAFDNFRVVPPGKGIVHQINLEYLATVVTHRKHQGLSTAFPDTVFGTDSHTPMINGLGVLGWGVGGIEAISALLGNPVDLVLPDVIGLEFQGSLPDRVTPTDLCLTIVERLRQVGVVGKFVECFGSGLDQISIPDRAMIANMSPESGATVTYFPVDGQTLTYLSLTGRNPQQVALVEAYCRAQGLFRHASVPDPQFTEVITIDLSQVEASLAGPFRPQDRVGLSNMRDIFVRDLARSHKERGFNLSEDEQKREVRISVEGKTVALGHGSLLIAAITSCTNTSNPLVMLSAGLLAKKALERGLFVNPAVKCSLMPGSRVVTAYLKKAGLLAPLAELGFVLVGYGCGTCIGNSGPLAPEIREALQNQTLVTASISSGNRNFEGRIHPLTRANYLASPPLVVAYALAGTVDINLLSDPLGVDKDGDLVYFHDIYPTITEVKALFSTIQPEIFKQIYADLFEGDQNWASINPGRATSVYAWESESSYIQEPPYFRTHIKADLSEGIDDILNARVLALLGDSITTDHISPAGNISADSPAGLYLKSLGISEKDFNTYGARRGNDRVMTRGTFANIRLKNKLVPGREGGITRIFPDSEIVSIYDAAQYYQSEAVPLIVIAGKEYGTGSSRDWAAKGVRLLGVRAVIAESFERIHRANLVGMGVIPLEFLPGENVKSLGLTGKEVYDITGLGDMSPGGHCAVRAYDAIGREIEFKVVVRIDTHAELRSFHFGGILHEALLRYTID